jgi:pSer/pThr/pTyr-binding forkhead associated (FHA) protein
MPTLALLAQGRPIKTYHIQDNSDMLIGQSPSCGIRLQRPEVTSEHAWILSNSGHCQVMALNNKYPVLVNQRFIKQHRLMDGDQLEIGGYYFQFHTSNYVPIDKQARRMIRDNSLENQKNISMDTRSGYVQILDGKRLGRIIPLDRSLMRLGKKEGNCAVIAHRKEGYFLSHLKGSTPPKIDGRPIGEHSLPLHDGNIIQIGKIRLAFHAESH